jgi:tetratricopeptide (TPR) repeat protein
MATAAGCSREREKTPESFPGAPVVLISIDTLRSDHLPFYGYGGVETPALSGFRRDAVLFERAYSPVPLTLPAHASLFTGRLPDVHGIHDNLGYHLRPEVPTLAELLKGGGFRTGGAVSAFVLGATSGIGRGFDFYEDGVEPIGGISSPSLIQRPGGETAALLEKWIGAQGDARFLAFLHLYEPHTPYAPPEPYRTKYTSSPYDGEIAAADAIVGEFLSRLKETGIYDRALVILLSDHGESLGEHGEDEHGIFLYRSVLQVPLLLKLPKGRFAGTTVKDPVQLTDVFTTIGEATAVPGFPRIEGNVSLVALAAGAKAPARTLFAETWFPRIHYGWSDLASALDGRWHYVGSPSPEFYDLEADPGESVDLAGKRPGPFRAMAVQVAKRKSAFRAPEPVADEDRKKLAALGYLSTGAPSAAAGLPDPRTEIGLVRLLRDATARMASGKPREAAALLGELLKKNPAMTDVWQLYADALLASGRPAEALAAMRRTVELSPPDSTIPLMSVANLCLQVGLPDDAMKNARLALDRGDPAAHETLARAFMARGDLDGAEREARAALEVPRVRKRASLALAHIAVRRKDDDGALLHLDRIAASGGAETLPGYHYLRGDILARRSRFDEAASEFREEIRLFPAGTEARVGLAFVQASEGDAREAKRTLAEMVTAVGTAEAFHRSGRALAFLGDRPGAERLRRRAVELFPDDPGFRTPF